MGNSKTRAFILFFTSSRLFTSQGIHGLKTKNVQNDIVLYTLVCGTIRKIVDFRAT